MRKNIFLLIIVIFFYWSCDNETAITDISTDTTTHITDNSTIILQTYNDSIFYSLGLVVGQNIKSYGFKHIDINAFNSGLMDAMGKSEFALSPDVAKRILAIYLNKLTTKQYVEQQSESAKFMQQNATRKGIIITDSGLQYEVIKQGTGKTPTLNDYVLVNYRGTLIDGAEIGNTFGKQPVKFMVKNSLKGWQEALTMMREGDRWKIYLPPELAFGKKGGKIVKPNSVVIYEIELIKVLEK